jgi:hypothetical protein
MFRRIDVWRAAEIAYNVQVKQQENKNTDSTMHPYSSVPKIHHKTDKYLHMFSTPHSRPEKIVHMMKSLSY